MASKHSLNARVYKQNEGLQSIVVLELLYSLINDFLLQLTRRFLDKNGFGSSTEWHQSYYFHISDMISLV